MTYEPANRTTAELLGDWAAIMRELRARDVIRTDNSPVGDIAELIAHLHYGGERAGFSQKGWDLRTPEGERLQVKGLKITATGNPGRNLSPISGSDYEAVVVVVFDEDFRVTDGLHIPREVIEERFTMTPKGLRMRLTQGLRADGRVSVVDFLQAHQTLHS
jgi:hypothetical protein